MNIADLTTASPAVIDTAWAEALMPVNEMMAKAIIVRTRANHEYKQADRFLDERQSALRERHFAAGDKYTAEADRLAAEAAVQQKLVEAPFKAEWTARGGWTRAYKAGHVHSSTNCSTCHKMGQRTELYWVTELSGMTTDEIAELAGEAACTVCYPNAPVNRPTEIFTPAERATAAERAEKAAKLAAKKADADAKSITDVDGSPLKDARGYIVKTERTARMELTNALADVLLMNGPTYIGRADATEESKAHWARLATEYAAGAAHLAKAIAAKTGETVEEVTAAHQAKADKKQDKLLKEWAKSPHNPANQ